MKIIVTTDSTSDLTKELVEKHNIIVMPLIVTLGEDTFEDGVTINAEDIFNYVEKTGTLPKTCAKSTYLYKEFFEKALKDNNADALIHISLSSELSCTCQNAKIAASELEKVEVVDSCSLSSGCALLVLEACEKIQEGKSLETIVAELNALTEKVQASFIINNLKYLYKGGRCSAVAMFGANVLRIKPKIKLSCGKMVVDKKYMGKFEAVVLNYVKDLLNENKEIKKDKVFITYTTEHKDLNDKIIEILKSNGFENIITNFAGSTISSHCGPDTLGVLFINA